MIGTLSSGVTALVFPLFASYRALVSNDVTSLRPWLMYWVVFGSFQFTESSFYPISRLVPFYGCFRLGFLVWLVAPQSQGAVQLYQSRLEPWSSRQDETVENAIAGAAELVHSSGYARISSVFGINSPKPPPPGSSSQSTSAASGVAAWASSWASGSSANPQKPASSTGFVDSSSSSFRSPGTPDSNLSAYSPTLLGASDKSEYSAIVRNRSLSMVRSIDTRQDENVPRDPLTESVSAQPDMASSSSRDTDEYDFVETPQRTPQPHETEIEREVEESLRHEQPQGEARRRWI